MFSLRIWISLPFSLLHLIFAILALAFLEEDGGLPLESGHSVDLKGGTFPS